MLSWLNWILGNSDDNKDKLNVQCYHCSNSFSVEKDKLLETLCPQCNTSTGFISTCNKCSTKFLSPGQQELCKKCDYLPTCRVCNNFLQLTDYICYDCRKCTSCASPIEYHNSDNRGRNHCKKCLPIQYDHSDENNWIVQQVKAKKLEIVPNRWIEVTFLIEEQNHEGYCGTPDQFYTTTKNRQIILPLCKSIVYSPTSQFLPLEKIVDIYEIPLMPTHQDSFVCDCKTEFTIISAKWPEH